MAKAEASVEELVSMIARGELRLPAMQRRYVWRSTRVRAGRRCRVAARRIFVNKTANAQSIISASIVPSGMRVLKKAVIQKVDDEEIVIQHAEGVKLARATDLPAELKDRFRLGALTASKPAPVAVMPTAESASAAPSGEVVSAARQKYDKKLLDARLATERMQKDLETLKQQLSQAESDMNAATSATRKFYTKSRRDQISQQVQAMQARVTNAEIELKRIEGAPPVEP